MSASREKSGHICSTNLVARPMLAPPLAGGVKPVTSMFTADRTLSAGWQMCSSAASHSWKRRMTPAASPWKSTSSSVSRKRE